MLGKPLAFFPSACGRCEPTGAPPALATRSQSRIQGDEIGGLDVFANIHFHAVYDGAEIIAIEPKIADGDGEAAKARTLFAAINRVNVLSPAVERFKARLSGALIVGDVVDRATERVDFEHRLALAQRHDAHGRVKGAAERAPRRLSCLYFHVKGLAGHRSPVTELAHPARRHAARGRGWPL